MKNTLKLIALSLSAVTSMLGGAVSAGEYLTSPQPLDSEGFQEIFVQVAPNVYMSGQPAQEGLARAKSLGVAKVINLRTHHEMNDREVVPYDEAAAAAELGLEYVHLPLGGPDTPYSPAAVTKLGEELASSDTRVLLHCTVAWRASHLWTAHLIENLKVPFAEAVAIGRELNLGRLPLEGFLGKELTILPVAEPATRQAESVE